MDTAALSRALWIAVSALAISVQAGCEKPQRRQTPPPAVTVAHPVKKDVTMYHDHTGKTAAVESVEVRARVRGFLKSIDFQEGSNVKTGQLLFVIDPAEFEARRDRAKANLEGKRAERIRAQTNLDNTTAAKRKGAATATEVTEATAARDKAKAAVAAAEAELKGAELELAYTQVRSPIEGKVGRARVIVGNLVGAGENTLLTTVVKMDPMYVYFDASERTFLRVLEKHSSRERQKPRRKAFLGLSHQTGYPFKGRMDYVENKADETTGTIRVRAVFPNDRQLLYPGLFARIRVPGEVVKDALLVEPRAIGSDFGGKYVLVVNAQNLVEHRSVRLGGLFQGMRVVLRGLTAGDRYIVKGLQRARPGRPVKAVTREPAGRTPEGRAPATAPATP